MNNVRLSIPTHHSTQNFVFLFLENKFKLKMSKPVLVGLALGLIFMSSFTGQCYGQLEVGFYKGKCSGKDVEAIVGSVIATKIKDDPMIVAALLRLQFHDCFVRVLVLGHNARGYAIPLVEPASREDDKRPVRDKWYQSQPRGTVMGRYVGLTPSTLIVGSAPRVVSARGGFPVGRGTDKHGSRQGNVPLTRASGTGGGSMSLPLVELASREDNKRAGCDASILLDGSNSEKTAPINLHLRGFDIIDAAKAAVEAVCPGVVSCADIIVMATRDSVAKSKGMRYDVQTGRRDGFISLAQNTVDIPTPNISVSDSIKAFDKKGLGFVDMVYLLGAHTVGVAHCSTFIDRLYNFKNTGKPDPSMNDELLTKLRSTCPQNATVDNIANLDQNPRTSIIVDNSYYYQILKHRGVLQIDQELVYDLRTVLVVLGATLELDFNIRFPHAMVNLGKVQVLTGTEGEIRKSCPAVNNPTAMAI
ncbi:unnamed protein product [Camellia sinensis]